MVGYNLLQNRHREKQKKQKETNTHIHTDEQFRAASLLNLHAFGQWEGMLEYLEGTYTGTG